ncbi:MAG: hypothetical protein VYA55_03185 [Pseudomonadota bacterium]|nr:hypothetical protein [Pseudomonadota bacterium]
MLYLHKLGQSPGRVFLITLVLTLPALGSGWLGDDYIHYALLHPDIQIPRANDWSLFGLFSWVDATPERTRVLIDQGVIPWWTYEEFRYQFWRPLAELSHWLDHRLWRDSARLMHVQSLLWYLGLGWALYHLLRRMGMSQTASVAALAVYLWDSTHGLTLSWIANRNALMAALFGVLCVLGYVRWRESGAAHALALSLLWLMCSLFSGEIGISTCAYLGAYALMVDRSGPRRALLALWPYFVISVAWWVTYKLGNFGANNSDANYIDPVESPLSFLSNLGERIPVLLFAQFGLVPADVFGFNPESMTLFALVSVIFLVLVVLVLWPLLRDSAQARFWALGCVFAAVPISATVPADRNLLMVGIGASALLGMLFDALAQGVLSSRLQRTGAYVLFVLHLMLAPLLMPLLSYSPVIWNQLMSLPMTKRMPVQTEQDQVLLFGMSMPIALATTPMRFAHHLTVPANAWLISSRHAEFTVSRVAEDSIRIESSLGMIDEFEQTVRDLQQEPLAVGQEVRTTAMTMTVLALDDAGSPTRLDMRFHSTGAQDVVIIYWDGEAFRRSPLPPVGERLRLNLTRAEPDLG